ncbi:MAG: antibiotic biosynthesis monooxygenase [Nocardioidaceae bacterium]
MLAISRFRYDEQAAGSAESDLTECLDGLGACRGFLSGAVGRALDDPGLWLLETRWESVGAYRRALSSYEIKMAVVPLLSRAVDEPSAYEIIVGEGATKPNESHPRGTVA